MQFSTIVHGDIENLLHDGVLIVVRDESLQEFEKQGREAAVIKSPIYSLY